MMNYFIATYMVTILVLGVRNAYWGFKLSMYINNNFSAEVIKKIDFGFPGTFKYFLYISKEDRIDDPRYIFLKKKTHNSLKLVYIFGVSIPLLLLLIEVIKRCF